MSDFYRNANSALEDAAGNDAAGCAESQETAASSTLSVADAEATEGPNVMLDFEVTLEPAATVTVDYATSDGMATAGSDYTARSGSLIFAVGETTKTVSVPVIDDSVEDDGETLTLTLSSATGGATIGDAQATGTIRNDEATGSQAVTVSVSDGSASEGDTVAFTVSLSAASAQQVTVDYATSSGTATSRTDFTAASCRTRCRGRSSPPRRARTMRRWTMRPRGTTWTKTNETTRRRRWRPRRG